MDAGEPRNRNRLPNRRAVGLDNQVARCRTGYSGRAEIGYLAHPEARGAGVVPASEPVGDGGLDDLVLYSRP